MSVTESPEWKWKWWPGMRLLCDVESHDGKMYPSGYVMDGGVVDGAPHLYKKSDILANEGRIHDSDSKVENIRPDLGDPATQGAIVFGIFEPLGIVIRTRGIGVCRPNIIRGACDLPSLTIGNILAIPPSGREDAIVSVFSVLDAKPQGTLSCHLGLRRHQCTARRFLCSRT